jgi:hypothetical protein
MSMKRFLLAGLFALPLFALTQQSANAFYESWGQKSCSYSFCCPQLYFGFNLGGCPAYQPPCPPPMPVTYPGCPNVLPFPNVTPLKPAPKNDQEPAKTEVPATYRYTAQPAAPAPAYPQFQAPAYWFSR